MRLDIFLFRSTVVVEPDGFWPVGMVYSTYTHISHLFIIHLFIYSLLNMM